MIWLDCLYLAALLLLSPWLVWRSLRTGRYRQNLLAKFWGTSTTNPKKQFRVWFHGVSVGEIHLLASFIKVFQQHYPEVDIIVSSTTDTGLNEARKKWHSEQVIVFPLDLSWAVNRTLNSVQPDLIVLAESELWPNFLRLCNRRKIPVVVINGRMSPRSEKRNLKFRRIVYALLLKRIQLFLMQSATYAQAMQHLGVPPTKIAVTGSIKYDGVLLNQSNLLIQELKAWLQIQPEDVIWVAGSTHAPEEEVVIETWKQLQPHYPHLRLILVPRSADRFEQVAHLIQSKDCNVIRRSGKTTEVMAANTIVLIDTIGELNAVWSLADIGYVGGSLDGKRGGQSMIEPAGFGVATVFGPYVWNFRDAAKALVERGGAYQIRQPEHLLSIISTLIEDTTKRHSMGQIAKVFVQEQQGAIQRTLEFLEPYLPKKESM